ncbi:hypothetical protein J6590_085867 [Homalodisca vitripennis]|nr:hypothetical protein J6590_085867 [Homalodisca vitripennis]
MNCKSKSVSSKPGNFPYPEQLRSYWVVNRKEFAEVASGTTLLPGVRCSESQSCQGFERVKLATRELLKLNYVWSSRHIFGVRCGVLQLVEFCGVVSVGSVGRFVFLKIN